VLVLGEPDRDSLYAVVERVEARLGRPVLLTVRDSDWLDVGDGSFYETVRSRPMVPIPLDAGVSSS